MRVKEFGLVALVAALTVLPTLSVAPADASVRNWLQRTILGRSYNSYYDNYNPNINPYIYNGGSGYVSPPSAMGGSGPNMNQLVSSGQISRAQHDAWVNSINARVSSGQLSIGDANMILTRGFE